VDAIDASLTQLIEEHRVAVVDFVHCAGMLAIRPLRLSEHVMAQETMNVNFMSAVVILRSLIRRKLNGKHLRRVVFISSTASQFGAVDSASTARSKGALDAFMRAMGRRTGAGRQDQFRSARHRQDGDDQSDAGGPGFARRV